MHIHDPEAAKRSIMLKQKSLCNGEKTGFRCKHYFFQIGKMDVDNPDHLRQGLTTRLCFVHPSDFIDLGDGGSDMAVECTHFVPTEHPYRQEWEEYKPLTVEEVRALEAAHQANKEAMERADAEKAAEMAAAAGDMLGPHLAKLGVADGVSGIGAFSEDDDSNDKENDDDDD